MTACTVKNLDEMTDAELNEAFAVEVANAAQKYWVSKDGFYYRPPANGYTANLNEAARYTKEVASNHCAGCRELRMGAFPLPSYTTDANAVLPWLEKLKRWEINYVGDATWKERAYCADLGGSIKVLAPTFARAAVIALIRAARATP